jgi:hypothetical protein
MSSENVYQYMSHLYRWTTPTAQSQRLTEGMSDCGCEPCIRACGVVTRPGDLVSVSEYGAALASLVLVLRLHLDANHRT